MHDELYDTHLKFNCLAAGYLNIKLQFLWCKKRAATLPTALGQYSYFTDVKENVRLNSEKRI